MLRLSKAGFGLFFSVVSIAVSSFAPAWAVPPADVLLPSTTKAMLSIPRVAQMKERWHQTQLGQLIDDPTMKPFTDDLKEQIKERLAKSRERVSLSWEDIEGIAGGEVSFGMTLPAEGGAPRLIVLADVTGRGDKAQQALVKATENLAKEKYVRSEEKVGDTTIVVHRLEVVKADAAKTDDKSKAAKPGKEIRTVAWFLRDNLLCASDDVELAKGVLGRMAGETPNSLKNLPAYQAVMARAKSFGPEIEPDLRWFVEPMGLADVLKHELASSEHRKGKSDIVKTLKNQGFGAIQGAGGLVNLAAGKYELLHRTAVFTAPRGDWKTGSVRMLSFPNGGRFTPQPWVPREVATYTSLNLDVANVYNNLGPLVDELANEKDVWKDIVDGLKEEDGPQIDLEKDLIAHLGKRLTVISDYQLPITTESERLLVAVDSKDDKALTVTLGKWFKGDESARKIEFEGHEIWEIIQDDEKLEGVDVVVPGAADEKAKDKEKRKIPNHAVTVAHGQLFVATHVDFLRKMLHEAKSPKLLEPSPDYRLVTAELDKLGISDACLRAFSRTDEEYRATYELLREGKMPEGKTMLAKVLNRILGDRKPKSPPRQQKIDGKEMPDFDVVRRYLGPAGAIGTEDANGWYIVGFTLNKQAPTDSTPAAKVEPTVSSGAAGVLK